MQIHQTHNYNSDLITIMNPQKGVGIAPASVTFRLPTIISLNNGNQLFMCRIVMTEMSPRLKRPDQNVPWQKRSGRKVAYPFKTPKAVYSASEPHTLQQVETFKYLWALASAGGGKRTKKQKFLENVKSAF